jgi:phenylacetate-CoA ligase
LDLKAYGDWRKAAKMLAAAAELSGFVAAQLERSNLSVKDATASAEGFRALRPLLKQDFLEDQQAKPPFGRRLVVPLAEIGLIVESSGSSGRGRETHYLTRRDMDRLAALWADHLAALGITSNDIVALTFPIGMAGGGVKHAAAYTYLGAKTLRVSNLSTLQKLDAMRYYSATALVATPSYVDRLAVAAEEVGTSPAALGIKRLVVATQSVSEDWVRRTEAIWGAKLHEWYGTSAGLVAFSCTRGMVDVAGRGTLHWADGSALSEVVNPTTGDLVADGERGELVGTVLINEAEPFFRYATGDEVKFIAGGSCSCGSSLPGIESGTVRRLDQMFKVKGVNLWAAAVEAVLFSLPPVQDYRARFGYDSARREVASIDVLAPQGDDSLASEIGSLLHDSTGIHFVVAVERRSSDWIHETAGEAAKTRRWLDERKL